MNVKAILTVKAIKSVAIMYVVLNVFEIYFLNHLSNFEENFVIFYKQY
jgi:hypothetical protein